MTDADYEAQKARLGKLVAWWTKALGLRWWTIKLEYERVPSETVCKDTEGKWQTVFRVYAKWQYADATIYVNMPELVHLSDAELEMFFVHELAHVLINETRQADKEDWLDHEERVATTLAKALVWLRDITRDEAKTQEVEA